MEIPKLMKAPRWSDFFSSLTAAVLVSATLLPHTALGQQTDRSGKDVVDSVCAACHKEGLNGAPKIGDKAAWIPRLRQGLHFMVRSAIRGHGGMPPRGGVASLTDNEIRNAVTYMFHPVMPAPEAHGAARGDHGMPAARENPNHKIAADMDIYLGVIPAKHLLDFPSDSPERSMHGGVPRGDNYQHVNITLIDRKKNTPISGASVNIQVQEPGLTNVQTTLQPMGVGAGNYGTYVRMSPNTKYRITVQVRLRGSSRTTEVQFEHEH